MLQPYAGEFLAGTIGGVGEDARRVADHLAGRTKIGPRDRFQATVPT